MSHVQELEDAVAKRRKINPMDSVASFAEVSCESEIEEGVDPSIASAHWLNWLAGKEQW